MDARLAKALHAELVDLGASGFVAVWPADMATAVVADRRGLLRPFAGERLDGPLGDAGFLGSPFGCLGDAVMAFAEDVVEHLLGADDVRFDVVLVVGAFLQPHVHDGEVERRVGVR